MIYVMLVTKKPQLYISHAWDVPWPNHIPPRPTYLDNNDPRVAQMIRNFTDISVEDIDKLCFSPIPTKDRRHIFL